jgi:hypothetical protein
MTLAHKTLLGLAAILLAGAASFPHQVADFYRGGYPLDMQKRAALELCHETNPSFVRFLASERASCYAQVKNAGSLS